MEVVGLALDSSTNSPIVLLREAGGERLLPIWIGIVEASAIAFELEAQSTARPLTHALLVDMLGKLSARVVEARIADLKDNTYFAELRVLGAGNEITVDARPSDAIAIALRARVPIACAEEVLARVQTLSNVRMDEVGDKPAGEGEGGEPAPDPQPKVLSATPHTPLELKELLAKLNEEDFGKYKM